MKKTTQFSLKIVNFSVKGKHIALKELALTKCNTLYFLYNFYEFYRFRNSNLHENKTAWIR
jgi:hypothetical protein